MSNFVKISENVKRNAHTFIGVALQEDEHGVVALACNLDRQTDGIQIDSFPSNEYSVEPASEDLVKRVFSQVVDELRKSVGKKMDNIEQAERELAEAEFERDRSLLNLNRSLKYALDSGINLTKGDGLEQKSREVLGGIRSQVREAGVKGFQ